jgi:hypothetical protein
MELQDLIQEANKLSIEDLRELADFCITLADSLEGR